MLSQNLSRNEIVLRTTISENNLKHQARLIAVFSNAGVVAALAATAAVAAVPNLEHTRNRSQSLNPNPPSAVAHAQSPSEYLIKKKVSINIYMF